MNAGYFECHDFEPFTNLINHNFQRLSQVGCMLCNYVSIFTKDHFNLLLILLFLLQLLKKKNTIFENATDARTSEITKDWFKYARDRDGGGRSREKS